MNYKSEVENLFRDLMIEHGKRKELDGIKSMEEANTLYSRELKEAQLIASRI